MNGDDEIIVHQEDVEEPETQDAGEGEGEPEVEQGEGESQDDEVVILTGSTGKAGGNSTKGEVADPHLAKIEELLSAMAQLTVAREKGLQPPSYRPHVEVTAEPVSLPSFDGKSDF